MAAHRKALSGRRGWSAVVGLSTVLAVLVAGQLPAASSEERPLAAVTTALGVLAPLVPTLAPSPSLTAPAVAPELRPVRAARTARTVSTSAADRLPGPLGARRAPVVLPAAAPVKAAPVTPAAKAAPAAAPARKPVARVAKPAAARQPAPGLCSGPGWEQRRGQAALASVKGGAARTGFRVEFKGARSGYMGLTHLNERRIEMFVRSCAAQSAELLRHVMAHELGHGYDTTRNDAATRRAWLLARGIPLSTPWYGCSGCSDFATPAGDFAEVYAQWARGASSNRSKLAGDVPPAQLAALARQFFGA